MKRRKFISHGALFAGGTFFAGDFLLAGATPPTPGINNANKASLYEIFRKPELKYHPFVRWWWNGNKIEKKELIRELHLLKEAGIGGVEINPIEFPHRIEGDDLGIKSLQWLSDEWIEMLQITFAEAKKLGITCDLIVGSGWPFGSETLDADERAEALYINVEHIEGPSTFSIERADIIRAIDPKVSVPYPGRTFEILSLKMVPDPMDNLDQVVDLSEKSNDTKISLEVPDGKYALYALVKVSSFASVINGAPGAAGPILNHMDKDAVEGYLNRMSDTLIKEIGPLSEHLRALFTDSMELEGCNWTGDFREEFQNRRGYDIMLWLPFIMFKVGRLGGVIDDKYGVEKTETFTEETNRVRFDFEFTKAELLYERFTKTYLNWCRKNGVKSRAQSYGRGFFPLETSLGYDIPEGESWTTNWLKHRVGEEMPDDDYRRGRAYTMINKYVSSAAHLSGSRLISCEEMTNTYLVFNTSLERLKNGSDQSIISGITHSVWHGFNYSPPGAPYPGWIQYGSYLNEQNNWWPYFKYLNAYRSRISALLQNADMYTDIAILPANYDLWSSMGVQTDPFPEKLNVQYTSLLWEAICKTGGAADYISETVLKESYVQNGMLCFGLRKYSTIFLAGVSSIYPETLKILHDFVSDGGRVFCIETLPSRSPGFDDYQERDLKVKSLIELMKEYPDRFILLNKPDDNSFLEWYSDIMNKYTLPHYLDVENPGRFVSQVRYQANNKTEIIFFSNSHIKNYYSTNIKFSEKIISGRYGWIWDPDSGERFRIKLKDDGSFSLNLGPCESIIFVFDQEKSGEKWKPLNVEQNNIRTLEGDWDLEFVHCRGEEYSPIKLKMLSNLAELEAYSHFSGKIIYRNTFNVTGPFPSFLELQNVHDIAELKINGINCGLKWYGKRLFDISGSLNKGINEIEIQVTTLMGNYMKSLRDNPTAQYWTNEKNKNQPVVPIGLEGPVTLFS